MARVLVIDDEASVRQLVKRALETQKHEVLEAGDGTTALQLIGREAIDLVISDVYMPEMDGIEFAARLAQQQPHPKLIAMSGGGFKDKESLLEMTRRLGAEATLEKPFTIQQLLDTVNDILKRGETQ